MSENPQDLKPVATEILEKLSVVSSMATHALQELRDGVNPEQLATMNTLNAGSALRTLQSIQSQNRLLYEVLREEPAIARVVVRDEAGNKSVYYVCRANQGAIKDGVISYRAPIGRIASLPVGEEYELPNGVLLEILEKEQFQPHREAVAWDAKNTVVELEEGDVITVQSLRRLLSPAVADVAPENLLDQLLAEEEAGDNLIVGLRRGVIEKMGLRDQPILDRHQDEIFRLPLRARLMLLGPPGTGKTTTLIRRLGQKRDEAFLEEDERNQVGRASIDGMLKHADSWLMFTPTELLKQYLKEAFAAEGVPAPDMRVSTWDDYRHDLARHVFRVLRTGAGRGVFAQAVSDKGLSGDVVAQATAWYEDFQSWHRRQYWGRLRETAQDLSQSTSAPVSAVGSRLAAVLSGREEVASTYFRTLAAEVIKVQALAEDFSKSIDKTLLGSLNLQLNRNRSFLHEFSTFLDALQQPAALELEEDEDVDADEEVDVASPKTGLVAAKNAYLQAIRNRARAVALKRSVRHDSRAGKILQWIGDRGISDADYQRVGQELLTLGKLRVFINPVRRFVDDIPRRYQAFRYQRQQEGRWYSKSHVLGRDIHPLELDLILLAMLKEISSLLSQDSIIRDLESPTWGALKGKMDIFRNQILVDEAADFSPIQLGCMVALANPSIRSFFACGDFNQRLTTWGSRSINDLRWAVPDVEVREINISYRQSQRLNAFSRAVIKAVSGEEPNIVLPDYANNEGVVPVLLEKAKDGDVIVWLAERITEIESLSDQLPSIAVLVNSEAEVVPIAEALGSALTVQNIQVVACHEGQAIGRDGNVRVFDIQHIKGLEFEAVFFVNVDQLAQSKADLFDKYLYVGSTRAATFLGITCREALPTVLDSVRPLLGKTWSRAELVNAG